MLRSNRLVGVLCTAFVVGLVTLDIWATPGEQSQTRQVQGAPPATNNDALVARAVSPRATEADAAIAELRAMGEPGLRLLLAEHDRIALLHAGGDIAEMDRALASIRAAVDQVARQRDASASRLYWFTDLEQAKAEAARTGRPILSLRLLGELDEDLSCANSRFFRSVLYANAEVSAKLREGFVLHWQSLRPVPRLTIDFGDGRRIERTITGNSIHYVLSPDGELLDAVPGLYGPKAFLRAIGAAEGLAASLQGVTEPQQRRDMVRAFHVQAAVQLDDAWRADVAALGAVSDAGSVALATTASPSSQKAAPLAIEAAKVTATKERLEMKALALVHDIPATPPGPRDAVSEEVWTQLAALHRDDAVLDESSINLIRDKMDIQPAKKAGAVALTKRVAEDPFLGMLRNLQNSVAADTVRNEYVIHRTLHQWLSQGYGQQHVEELNRMVYEHLFLSPLDDPWMGMAPVTTYAAVDKNGCE